LPAVWLVASGCRHTFPTEYGLDDLAADSAKWPGDALVHYLSRPDADAAQGCQAGRLARRDDELSGPLVAALSGRGVSPKNWVTCASTLLATLEPFEREGLLTELASRTPALANAPSSVKLVHRAFSSRPRGESQAAATLLRTLRKPDLLNLEVFDELRITLALDEGEWGGQRLTEALVAQLSDEALLRRIEARVPDEAVRLAARRRVVQLHLAASTVREVKERAAEVEAKVLATGRWAQPVKTLSRPAPQPPLTLKTALRGSQDIARQLVRLSTREDDDPAPPAIDVTPVLRFHVGWSQPLGLCAPREALDVTPCIDPTEVQLGTGFATLDMTGMLQFPRKLTMGDAVELTRKGLGIVVPVQLEGQLSQVLQVPLTMLAPSPFFFEGPPSSRGPAVNVVVVPSTQGLLLEAVDDTGARRQLVLPRGPTAFELGSIGGRGKQGSPGSRGANGSRGTNGMSASCPSMSGGNGGPGSSGSPGGQGGNGGPGGDGGPVKVEVVCGKDCDDTPLVHAVIRSRGGPGGEGGPGGAGGSGGDGGSGGSGTSCYSNGKTSSLSGGSSGSRGSNGATGPSGQRGAPGLDGTVQVFVR
jgi:hypothetical protein